MLRKLFLTGMALMFSMLAMAPVQAEPSIKDLATAEASKCDLNGNGRIEGAEVSLLRNAFAKKVPESYLYIFDENENKSLDDQEIAKLRLPARVPARRSVHPRPAPRR
jgi:hypothetical protein